MPRESYNSIEELEDLVAKFISKTLPSNAWTHFAHLSVGLWFVAQHGREASSILMPKYIKNYNLSLGNENTDSGGYHQTITQFWIWLLDSYWRNVSDQTPLLKAVNNLHESLYGNPTNFLKFYSKDLIFSTQARRSFIEPDLKEFDLADIINA